MKAGEQKYPPTQCVAIDVDNTLDHAGTLDDRVVDMAKRMKRDGFEVILWSARGKAHAQRVAEAHGVNDLFDVIISKPGMIVDDQGWRWTRYTRRLTVQ